MNMYRQGDILLIEADSVDGEYKADGIIAEGSITGHHHKIVNGKVYRQRRDQWNGIIGYVWANDGCQLVHDEHATIDLPEGKYKVIKQREVTGDVED